MGRHGSIVPSICFAHILCARMVHRYAILSNHPKPSTAPMTAWSILIRTPPRRKASTLTFANNSIVAYSLGIYLLNLFLAFLSPKFDPALEQDEGMEDGNASGLPTKEDQEFRPFVRRLPEFKFWYSTTKAIAIGFFCSWFEIFNLPVFWPVLVVYWLILFGLTSELNAIGLLQTSVKLTTTSATTNSAHDQVPLRSIHRWQDTICTEMSASRHNSSFLIGSAPPLSIIAY